MGKIRYSNKAIVALCTIAYFASYFSRKTFAVVMADMIPQVIDKDVAGLVGTALFVFYGLGQLISGYMGDKYDPKKLMFAGLLVSALCNILLPIVPNQYLMIPVWAVNGFAQALLWPPIVRILSDNLSHEKYVTANLVVTVGAHVSTILLYVYAPIGISFMSWKAVFFTSGAFCVVVGIVFIALMSYVLNKEEKIEPTKIKKEQESRAKKESLMHLFSRTGVITIFGAITAMGFMRDGIESWLPTLYSEAFGRDSSESILLSVILPVFAIISIFVIRAIHRGKLFNNEARGSGILFVMSIAFCIPASFLVNIDSPVARTICLVLAGLCNACMHACNFLLIGCVPGRFAGSGRASTISGVCNACTYIGAAISMYGIALVSDWLGWSATIISWIAICLIGLVFSIASYKKYTTLVKE